LGCVRQPHRHLGHWPIMANYRLVDVILGKEIPRWS
jgi:hypothetical protein